MYQDYISPELYEAILNSDIPDEDEYSETLRRQMIDKMEDYSRTLDEQINGQVDEQIENNDLDVNGSFDYPPEVLINIFKIEDSELPSFDLRNTNRYIFKAFNQYTKFIFIVKTQEDLDYARLNLMYLSPTIKVLNFVPDNLQEIVSVEIIAKSFVSGEFDRLILSLEGLSKDKGDKFASLSIINGIDDDNILILSSVLRNNTILKYLNLSSGNFWISGAHDLAEMLEENNTLETLDLEANSLHDSETMAIAESLHRNRGLLNLNLEYNSIADGGAYALSMALKENQKLSRLNLSTNNITDEGAFYLAGSLEENNTLTYLNLRYNSIGTRVNLEFDGINAFAEVLHKNDTLSTLILSDTVIGDEGAIALADALQINKGLRSLEIENCQISPVGIIAIANSLKNNTTLTDLKLGGNAIGNLGLRAVSEALETNKNIAISLEAIPDTGIAWV